MVRVWHERRRSPQTVSRNAGSDASRGVRGVRSGERLRAPRACSETRRMHTRSLIARATGKVRRLLADQFGRRTVSIKTPVPIVSFTFDDAPRTAFSVGGEILKRFGARATYFVSLGILDTETEVGKIASVGDLARAVDEGSELGCHTFDHLDAWHVSSTAFLASVVRNREALHRILPGARFHDFRVSEERGQAFNKVGAGKYLHLLPGRRTGDERGQRRPEPA